MAARQRVKTIGHRSNGNLKSPAPEPPRALCGRLPDELRNQALTAKGSCRNDVCAKLAIQRLLVATRGPMAGRHSA